MDNKIMEYHQFLNNIYEDAEKMLKKIMEKLKEKYLIKQCLMNMKNMECIDTMN